MNNFPPRIQGALGAAFFGGWSVVNIQHTPVPAALFDLSGAYVWSHAVQGLQRFRIAQRVETRSALKEVRSLAKTLELRARLVVGDVPFEGRPTLVRLIPTGSEILLSKPVRRGRERMVFAPTDLGGAANWWWINDLLAGVALDGPFPAHILEAREFVPIGVREGIGPVRLPGGRMVDPRREDLGAVAREERHRVRDDDSMPAWQRHLLEGQLRLLGSTLDFGNPSRVDRATVRTPVENCAITPTGELIELWTLHPEQPGPNFDLLIAGAVTSRVRLAMASSIAALRAVGGEWLHAATDSLLIAVTHNDEAEFVPCHGGSERRNRRRGLVALPIGRVEEILKVTGAPWRCQHGGETPMLGYVAGIYKYQLIGPETGEGVATESALGGNYLDPTGTGEKNAEGRFSWAVEASQAVARAGMRDGKSGPSREIDLPQWANLPALRPGVASTMEQIERLKRAFPEARIRPFTPYLTAVVDQLRSARATPIMLDVDLPPEQWLDAHWVDAKSGKPLVLTTGECPMSGQVRVATIRDVIHQWRIPDDPSTEAVEAVDDILEPGVRRVLPVRSRPELVELVGKEGDDLLSLMHDPHAEPGDQLTVYRRSDPWPSVCEAASTIECDELKRRLPLSARTLERALAGATVSGATKAKITAAVEDVMGSSVYEGPKTCARPGCGVPVSRRRRWCSDACRKKVERGRDAVDLHKVGAVRCSKCQTVTYGDATKTCPACGGKTLPHVHTDHCANCGVERIGDTESPCPFCEKGLTHES